MKLSGLVGGLLCCVVLHLPVTAQETSGSIIGRVIDEKGDPIVGSNVLLSGNSLQVVRGVASDQDGAFKFIALPVGSYRLEAQHVSRQKIMIEDIQVELGRTLQLKPIEMRRGNHELPEIIINERRGTIDYQSSTIAETVDLQSFEALPVDRDYQSIITLLPQTNRNVFGDQANVAGASGPENAYYIDGINVTDPFEAQSGMRLPYNFIKAVEVKTAGYQAEFGRSTGGIINVITHDGGNRFTGNVFGYFTNNRLSGEPLRGVVETDAGNFRKYDVGLSFSGPIRKDKLWFFIAYNPQFENETIAVPGFTDQTQHLTNHIFAGKINWQAAASTKVTLNLLGDISNQMRFDRFWTFAPPPTSLDNLSPLQGRVNKGGVGSALTLQHFLRHDFLLSASLSALLQRSDNKPQNDQNDPIFIDFTDGVHYSGGYGTRQEQDQQRLAGSLKLNYLLPRHDLKFGFEFEENKLDQQILVARPGMFLRPALDIYNVISYEIDYRVGNRIYSAFLQDSWRPADQLTINFGIRLDAQQLVGNDGTVAQSINDQWQPRLGIVYHPAAGKIFANYNRYYEQLPTVFAGNFGGILNVVSVYDTDPRIGTPTPVEVRDASSAPRDPVEGLKGQHFDEISFGFQRQIAAEIILGIKSTYRVLRQAIENGYDLENRTFIFGNPGIGTMAYMPAAKREYRSLELTLKKRIAEKLNLQAAYVLSRLEGNYEGLFEATTGSGMIRINHTSFDWPDQFVNNTGLLPNDRTHVLKLFAGYRSQLGHSAGTFINWQSGYPLNEMGASVGEGTRQVFLKKRGSVGRSPATWDLNFRFTYRFRSPGFTNAVPLVMLDLLHIGSPRKATVIDQQRFFGLDDDGNQTTENPNFLQPLAYQQPFTVRLSLQVGF